MYSFPELIKEIRKAADLTQAEFANILGVSTVLVSMIESEQKDVSKKFIIKLAEKLEVNPSSITPFLCIYDVKDRFGVSRIEKKLIEIGEALQIQLIRKKAKNLKKYAKGK